MKITVSGKVESALYAAFPNPKNAAPKALAKYTKALERLLNLALMHGRTPAQLKLDSYSISLHRLANEGGQIGPQRIRVHSWLKANDLELVQTVTQGSNLTGRLSEVKLTELVLAWEDDLDTQLDGSETRSGCRVTECSPKGSEGCDAVEVNMPSLRGYIQWLGERATLMAEGEKQKARAQAQWILANASGSGGLYYQRRKPSPFGRTYYEGVSIQNVNKELRRAILGDCWEYDIRSSVIAWKMGFASACLQRKGSLEPIREAFSATLNYLEEKADFMKTVRHFIFLEGTNVPKDLQVKLLKQAVTAISFGARATSSGWYSMTGSWTNPALVEIIKNTEERKRFLGDPTVRKFIQEQNTLDDFIFEQFKEEGAELLKETYLQTPSGRLSKAKVLAFYYQHSETIVMDVVRKVAAQHGHVPLDLPPASPTSLKLAKSVDQENDGHEEEQIHRGADHWLPQASRGRHPHQGGLPQRRVQRCHVLQVARQVRRHGGFRGSAAA